MAPHYQRGELFRSKAPVIGITTNSFVTGDEKLVMGRGAALEATKRYPNIQRRAGRLIRNTCGHLGKYGWLVFSGMEWERRCGLFQVKYHWKEEADLGLIKESVSQLNAWVLRDGAREVALNFPGIGNGRRKLEEVFTLIDELDPRVTIYYFESGLEDRLAALIAEASTAVPF